MCGRFTLASEVAQLQERFAFEPGEMVVQPSYNIAPGQDVLAVVRDGAGNRAGWLRWGLVPSWAKGLDIRRGGGETYADLAVRLEQAVGQIAERYEAHVTDRATVLVVSHGAAIKAFVAKILGVTPAGRRALGGLANASLSVVERDPRGRYVLHSWNDVAHLDGLVASEHGDDSVPR
jgi:hypothetical protein